MSTTYLNFHAPINNITAQHLMATCSQIIATGASEIYLMLSTPGGRVDSGLTLYNFLCALPCNVVTHNMGNIDSIGNAIFLAGKTRRACAHSTFMFHGVGFDIQNQRFEEKNLRESLDSVLKDQKRIGDIIVAQTSLTDDEAGKLFTEARTKDANDALKAGIIHEIVDLQIPPGAPIITLVLN
jgi:ATP-dependent protease ClpP protease subunit